MTMTQFIRNNKLLIDKYIRGFSDGRINNQERRLWILNDELLYHWARHEGVRI